MPIASTAKNSGIMNSALGPRSKPESTQNTTQPITPTAKCSPTPARNPRPTSFPVTGRGSDMCSLPSDSQGRKSCVLQVVAVKQVVSVEWDQPPVGMHDVYAALLHRTHIERVRIDELHDDHAEDVRIAQLLRNRDPGQTAQQI